MEGISSIVRQLKSRREALQLITVCLLGAALLFGSTLIGRGEVPSGSGILGGPSLIAEAGAAEIPTLLGLPQGEGSDIPNLPQSDPSLSTASLRAYGDAMGLAAMAIPESRAADADGGGQAETAKAPSRYFIQPASGLNWGILHDHNAVDIANTCGTTVVAAAEGTVTEAFGSGGWNSGYGNYVMIEHPNGLKTRYAHLEKVLVGVGDFVSQGKAIATIGNTGNVQGVTGCHLHFEVYGVRNPFAKK